MSFQTPITIEEAISHVHSGRYLLPAIQREFVWRPEQIIQLFDSVMKDYPIGSFLFWQVRPERKNEFQFYEFLRHYHERDSTHNPKAGVLPEGGVTAVLDGQQRLTSLYIGLRGTYASRKKFGWSRFDSNYPEKRLYLNLSRPSSEPDLEYEFAFRGDTENLVSDEDGFWFRVGHILSLADSSDLLEFALANQLNSIQFALRTLTRLSDVITRRNLINYYREEDQNLDKVLNVFIRVNSAGTKLSYSDLLLSIATAQWNDRDAREEINALVDDINQIGHGFRFSKDFVLKTCLMIAGFDTRWTVANFTKPNMERIESQWDEAVSAIGLGVRLLASFGFNAETLPSANAVLPVIYYLHRRGSPAQYIESDSFRADRVRVRRWLNIVLLKKVFTGQPDVTLRIVREAIDSAPGDFPASQIESALRASPRSMRFDEEEFATLLDEKYGKGYAYPILALLYPWLDFQHHFHQDHVHPRSRFTRARLGRIGVADGEEARWFEDNVDRIPNLQLLHGLPNQEKSDQPFDEWLVRTYPDPIDRQQYRERNLIPDVDLSLVNFREFFEARRALMIVKLKELVGFNPLL